MTAVQGAPVLRGNLQVRELDLRGFRVAEVCFPPGLHLPSHYHETACLTVMLDGTLRERLPGRTIDCPAGHVLAKPWGERHDDTFGPNGSRQIIVELPTAAADDLPECAALFSELWLAREPGAAALASRIAMEFRKRDRYSGLAIEALALELMVGMLRRGGPNERRIPSWLRTARDRLHDDLWAEHSTRDLAAVAGVHPGYFARQFRRHFGKSVGAYLRHTRLEWAATQLRESRRSLSELAHVARFADHSH
ncbi:MAG: helix-turn-helix domain-containing protein, partial [Gemmatimonadaceae bacterium]